MNEFCQFSWQSKVKRLDNSCTNWQNEVRWQQFHLSDDLLCLWMRNENKIRRCYARRVFSASMANISFQFYVLFPLHFTALSSDKFTTLLFSLCDPSNCIHFHLRLWRQNNNRPQWPKPMIVFAIRFDTHFCVSIEFTNDRRMTSKNSVCRMSSTRAAMIYQRMKRENNDRIRKWCEKRQWNE